MARLLSYLLTSGLTVGVGLVVVDAARFTVAQINEATIARCDTYNSVLPGSCRLP
jgi:hypothetical protein